MSDDIRDVVRELDLFAVQFDSEMQYVADRLRGWATRLKAAAVGVQEVWATLGPDGFVLQVFASQADAERYVAERDGKQSWTVEELVVHGAPQHDKGECEVCPVHDEVLRLRKYTRERDEFEKRALEAERRCKEGGETISQLREELGRWGVPPKEQIAAALQRAEGAERELTVALDNNRHARAVQGTFRDERDTALADLAKAREELVKEVKRLTELDRKAVADE